MKTIKGPGLFLAQFAGDAAPFNSWDSITKWAADVGYAGVQVPSWDGRLIDLAKAAESQDYCDEFKGVAAANGVEVTELSTHLQGQLVAVHPAYDTAFDELAKRWKPILDHAEECGVNVCYEIHPGEDLHDGVTYEMFLERVGNHPRAMMLYDPSHYVLQQLDYLDNIDIYHERIGMFHVKDAEFNPTGRQGVYSGYQPWVDRAGRFRSLGDGQVDFKAIFSKMAANDFDGWAVVEWECALKHPEDGAREGAQFVKEHIIRVTEHAFDDFAGSGADEAANRKMLGIGG
ncbi:MAG: sugar phosphate isomerase/epimerase [Paracoccaceae bacterium]